MIKKEIQYDIIYKENIWMYQPFIEIILTKNIPVYSRENSHLLKAYTTELPFFNNEKKSAFFYYYDDSLVGFFNICSHIQVPLDFDDERFFNISGNIVCKIHGAQFCPLTGKVFSGPARSPLFKVKCRLEKINSIETLIIEGFFK